MLNDYSNIVARALKEDIGAGDVTSDNTVPADLQAKVKARAKEILDGKFKVVVVETEPKSTAK